MHSCNWICICDLTKISKCRSIIVFTFQDCNENANTSRKIFSLFISMEKKAKSKTHKN